MKFSLLLSIILFLTIICDINSVKIGNEDYDAVCGNNWQTKYTETHQAILNGDLPQRYLVSVPVKAGLADVLLGYVSGFLWAILTNRAFMILHVDSMDNCVNDRMGMSSCRCNQRSIEHAYSTNKIDWKAPTLDRSQYRCMMPPYSESFACNENHLTRFREADKNESRIIHLNQVNGGYRDEFEMMDMTRFPRHEYQAELFMFASNRGITYNIFNNPFHIQTLKDLGLRRETVFPCLFNYLFKINDDVCVDGCKETEAKLKRAGDDGIVRIGIQVRDQNAGDAPEHFYCADSLITYYEAQGKQVIVLLVTASHALQVKKLQQYTPEKLLLPNGKPSEIVSVHDREDDRNEEISEGDCEVKTKKDEQAMRDSARDAYLMSLTDMQIIGRGSGFGVLGAMSRPRSEPALFRMVQMDGEDPDLRMCNATLDGDPLAIFAHAWSGL